MDRKKYIVWTDTGTHFRNAEFMHYLFKELLEQHISVSFNLFCEKHGKNSRDLHFSAVSNFIFKESMVKKLTSSQDICDAIMKQQEIANKNSLRLNELRKNETIQLRKLVNTKAFVIPIYSETKNLIFKLTVVGLKKYYNFFTSNSILYTHFMSDQLNFEKLNPTITRSVANIKIQVKTDKISATITDNSYLNIKMSNWKMMQRNRGNKLNLSEIASDHFDSQVMASKNYCIKTKCSGCKQICKYRLSEIHQSVNDKSLLNQFQVIQELSQHGHPKSRMNSQRKNRTFAEAKAELHTHYLENHFYSQ